MMLRNEMFRKHLKEYPTRKVKRIQGRARYHPIEEGVKII